MRELLCVAAIFIGCLAVAEAARRAWNSTVDVHARCPVCDKQMARSMEGWQCTTAGCRNLSPELRP